MDTRTRRTGAAVFNCLIVLTVGLTIAGCTSSRTSNQLISGSTHVDAVDKQFVGPNRVVSDQREIKNPTAYVADFDSLALKNPAKHTEITNAEQARSGVVIDESSPMTRSLVQNGVETPNQQYQLASIDSNAGDAMLRQPVLNKVKAYISNSVEENRAQQRIGAINSQMKHTSCKSGFATQPDKLDASRSTPGHPYYMEIRLRNTPLLPVGHTYVAYGRMSPDGTPLDEHLIMLSPLGGYGGAAIAAALPMPGVIKPVVDDCRIKPHAAYRITLDAQSYEKLLLKIQQVQKKIPAYALFAYNCNHFVADIVASVGILPSKNKYLPALKYIYSMIEANEGPNALKKG